MRRFGKIIVLLFLSVYLLYGQAELKIAITGRVVDASNGEGLPNVNVFLAGTTLGAASGADGAYAIRNVPPGVYELVVSMVVYERHVRTVRAYDGKDQQIDVRLKPAAIEIGTVEVTAKNPVEWKENFERFRKEFFGETINAKECTILNPEVLDFRVNGGVFEVAFHVPILIENRALGYEIEFYIEEFRMEKLTIQYRARTKFQELTPRNERERESWNENRRRAYRGSRKHFLTALARGTVREEGFDIRIVPNLFLWSRDYRFAKPVEEPQTLLQSTEYGFQKKLLFPDYLEVIYRFESAEPGFRQALNTTGSLAERQISWVQMNRVTVLFDTGGNLIEPFSLKSLGYWAFERVAETLPLDYVSD